MGSGVSVLWGVGNRGDGLFFRGSFLSLPYFMVFWGFFRVFGVFKVILRYILRWEGVYISRLKYEVRKNMARTKGVKNQKTEWVYDEVVAEIREQGKIPCNRTSFREASVREAIKKRTDGKGQVDLNGLIGMMKLYHGSNPDRLDKKLEKLKEQYEALKAQREAIEE